VNTVTSVRAFLLLGYREFTFFKQSRVLQFRRNMKTATVRELRNRYTQLLKWLDAGEEIRITRRGVVIARLVPENHAKARRGVIWSKSAAFALDRLNLRPLAAKESAELLDYNKGPF
jgi:antitoxin (DNA-binding transcriptional repressor) of toxin-antitoxin stability system